MKAIRWLILGSLVAAALLVACEHDDDDDKPKNPPATNTTNNVSSDPHKVLLGTWTGTAGTAQGSCTFILSNYNVKNESSDHNNGTLIWANGDTRRIDNALYDGVATFTCYLYDSQSGDTSDGWTLTFDGNASLTGSGEKFISGDNPIYKVRLTRQQ